MPDHRERMAEIASRAIGFGDLRVGELMVPHGHLVLLEDILRPVHVVLTISPALEVLEVLQRRRTQIAIVVDERGAVVGLVTVEDLVEELLGNIFRERPRVAD